MRTIFGGMIFVAACGGRPELTAAPVVPCQTTSAPAPSADKTRSAELDRLAARRLEALKAVVELSRIQVDHATLSQREYVAAKRELVVAARDSGMHGDELVRILVDYLAGTKMVADLARRRTGADEQGMRRADADVAEAEYWLAEAKERP